MLTIDFFFSDNSLFCSKVPISCTIQSLCIRTDAVSDTNVTMAKLNTVLRLFFILRFLLLGQHGLTDISDSNR